jgi:hypothetical protein
VRGIAKLEKLKPDHDELSDDRLELAQVLHRLGDDAAARPFAELALATLIKTSATTGWIAYARAVLADSITKTDPARARELLEEAVAAWTAAPTNWETELVAARVARAKLDSTVRAKPRNR